MRSHCEIGIERNTKKVNIAAFSGEIKLHITLHLVQVTCAETYVDALEFSNAVLQLFHLGGDLA